MLPAKRLKHLEFCIRFPIGGLEKRGAGVQPVIQTNVPGRGREGCDQLKGFNPAAASEAATASGDFASSIIRR